MQKKSGPENGQKLKKSGCATMILPVQKTKKIACTGTFALHAQKKNNTAHSRQLFSQKILVARHSLHDVYSTLLPLSYWQRVTHCYLFAVCFPITVWFLLLSGWTPSFSLLARRRSPPIGLTLTTCNWLLPASRSRLNFHFFLFLTLRWTIRSLVVSS